MTTPVDVMESSAEPTPTEWPRSLDQIPAVIVALGAISAVISLIKPWQTTILRPDSDNPGQVEELTSTIVVAGTIGTAFMVGLIALVAAAVVALFGSPGVRHTARLLGLGLAGATAAIGGILVYHLGQASTAGFYYGILIGSDANIEIRTESGGWFGVSAAVLAGLGLFLARSSDETRPLRTIDDYDEFDDDEPRYGEGIEVIDMTVKAG
ncbi:hypothetical protein F4553_004307 [Allocatelliglobosispora scoriae]|uniref:Uncharacterized protein n=1 Tax=Allocatelliglobosispora scoriae TaxID=643052 RepID=A0A841BU05_9ACTN|nr:hypothetical protein [Allocatelliglobosispora scoriae]MBB5870928.1 hypothetical protein [Allocatelliglobosispora scoriae]